jgi:hypothetical protein
MVQEVNKIIYNMLISGRGVELPGIGVLFIERQAARKIATYRVLSPRNVVIFSQSEQAPSLVDEIVAIAKCQREQAEDIYERWKSKTYVDGKLTIGGVGMLTGSRFSSEKSFSSAINPQGVKTIVIRKRTSHMWLYVVSAVAVVVALAFLGYIIWGQGTEPKRVETKPAAVVESQPAVDSVAVAAPVVEQPAPEPVVGAYGYYVVMGVFSTPENAARAEADAQKKIKDVKCEVLPFKGKYMVTIFGSNNRSECNTFVSSYSDVYGDLWVYNKK